LYPGTSASSSIVKDQFHKIAGGLWSKILWISTPQDNTRQEFIVKLQQFVTNVALGRWDSLERQDITFGLKKSWLARILFAVRWSLLEFGPIVLFYSYEHVIGPLNAPLGDYARLVTVVWLIANVISVDPLWKEKLSAVKDLITLKSKSKEESNR
jgi:hypothetical protein